MRYKIGDSVRVRAVYPVGHVRTPFYARGKTGRIVEFCGLFPNPEELAYGRSGLPPIANYRVLIKRSDVWPDCDGHADDGVCLEIYEHWLEPAQEVVR